MAGRKRPSCSSVSSSERRRRPGTDPADLRRINFVQSFPHQTPVILTYDVGDYETRSLTEGARTRRLPGLSASAESGTSRGQGQAARHRNLGHLYRSLRPRALARSPASLGSGVGGWESAEIRVNPTGSVEVLTGSHSHGQGHETTFAQLVSARLGVPMENVSVIHGDTETVQFGMGTYGSRSGAVGMSAIVKALDKVEVTAKKVAWDTCSKSPKVTSSSRNGIFYRQGHRQSRSSWGGGRCLTPILAPQVQPPGARARPQGNGVPTIRRTSRSRPAAISAKWRSTARPGSRDHRTLDRGRRFREAYQSDDRRRPGPRRRRPGRRTGSARERDLRPGRSARHRLLHGLLDAARRRSAVR